MHDTHKKWLHVHCQRVLVPIVCFRFSCSQEAIPVKRQADIRIVLFGFMSHNAILNEKINMEYFSIFKKNQTHLDCYHIFSRKQISEIIQKAH